MKYGKGPMRTTGDVVTLRVRVWIEISAVGIMTLSGVVTLRVRVWIEMASTR